MKTLCQNGKVKGSKKEKDLDRLAKYGVIFVDKNYLWQNMDSVLSYELSKGVNCKNEVANEKQLLKYV